ncbi:MAG: hypothetical protein IKO74_02345 [Selenomonadaceae bacterium]|nr:hypothetical protein [Selenomonadaceae bacterium]
MTLKIAYKREDRPTEIAVLTFQTSDEKSFDLDATLVFAEKKDGSDTVKTTNANVINYRITEA